MDFMNVFSALVVQPLVLPTGGILKSISVQLFSCKPIDGLLIPETNIQKKDLRR